jgi:predicted transcriptional regulator
MPITSTSWKPGQSGNLKGQTSLIDLLREELAKTNPQGISKSQLLMQTIVEMAIEQKNIRAIKEILNRLEGKSLQPVVVENFNYDALTTEQLEQMKEIVDSANNTPKP